MAEGIAEYLATHPHRQPLIIQCNGSFHSDYGLGTAARVSQRVPLAQAAIVSMIAVADLAKADVTKDRKKAHYLLIVTAPQNYPPPPSRLKKEAKKSLRERSRRRSSASLGGLFGLWTLLNDAQYAAPARALW